MIIKDKQEQKNGRNKAAHIALSFLAIAFMLLISIANADAQSASANFAGFDIASQGNWQSKYGSDGYVIANASQSLSSYATFTPQGQMSWTWASPTSDARALQTSSGRTATTWYSPSGFSMDIVLGDGKPHLVAVYAVDWDMRGRSETVQILDGNSGSILDMRSISNFVNGTYMLWTISGHVRVNVQLSSGVNAVVSGVFFGGSTATSTPSSSSVSNSATFVNLDASSEGTWQKKYGADGYSISGGPQNLPSYAVMTLQNQLGWTWAPSTTDPRALAGTNGVTSAATWYNEPSFSIDVNTIDGKAHQLALYVLDWDVRGRVQTVQIVDGNTGASLNSQTISNFSNGVYLVWSITGHVKVNVTMSAGPNSVISGVFFGGASTSAPAAPSNSAVAPAITTQPSGQTVNPGQSATFSVADTGTAPITYQWQKNGVAISTATSSSYTTPAAVSTDNGAQFTVVVTNAAGTVSSSTAVLKVNPATLILNVSTTTLSFGSVNVSGSGEQTVTLTNAGTGSVTISSISVSGAGFNASGIPAGTVLAPGQSSVLTATFSPASSGSLTGNIMVSSNATSGTKVITLAGTGVAPVAHTVNLSWTPSTSSVIGYNVYVSLTSGTGYAKLTSSPVGSVNYSDTNLQTAQIRYYVVTSVDSNNVESAFSKEIAAVVP